MRHDDWVERLDAYIIQESTRPFKWGGADCGTFIAGAIKVMNGVDITHWRDRYHSKFGAWRLVSAMSCKTFGELEAKIVDGVAQRMPLCSQPTYGNIVLADAKKTDPNDLGLTLGLISRAGQFIAPGDAGLMITSEFKPEILWNV
jgi:hypothetical protein